MTSVCDTEPAKLSRQVIRSNMRGTIDRIEEKIAVIKFDNGEQINYPVDDLLFDIKEGDAIDVLITKNETNTIETENNAKNFLNDILKD